MWWLDIVLFLHKKDKYAYCFKWFEKFTVHNIDQIYSFKLWANEDNLMLVAVTENKMIEKIIGSIGKMYTKNNFIIENDPWNQKVLHC